MRIRFLGPLLIGIAAILWGTDSFFRSRTLLLLEPDVVVFWDHVFGFFVLALWNGPRHGIKTFALDRREWLAAAFVGVGGSALAMLLFTMSFRYVSPTLAVLLQKLQPVFVIVLAALFLGERPKTRFFLWGGIAVLAAIVLSFPALDFRFYLEDGKGHLKGVLFAAGAALLWAAATIAGKILLHRTPSPLAVLWRYFFGMIALGLLLMISGRSIPIGIVTHPDTASSLLPLAVVSGLIPMLAYYAGLARTSASVATFVELVYPVSAVALNLVFLNVSLSPIQWVAGSVLLMSVTSLAQ